jgi:tetratricopeptide (TPR) repeat protein
MTRSIAPVLVLLVLSSFLVAQTDVRDNADLMVRVRTNDERSIEAPIQVELIAPRGPVATVHITGDEPAEFRVISGTSYRVKVSGLGFEAVTTPYFEINPLEQLHTETVHVKLENPKQAGESSPGSSTISVSELNIPRNASTEMKKGLDAYSKGDLEKAAAHFEKAIAEYPRYARAYDMLGAIAIKGSNRVKARELFSKSIQADGTFLPAYVDLARMDVQDQDEQGVRQGSSRRSAYPYSAQSPTIRGSTHHGWQGAWNAESSRGGDAAVSAFLDREARQPSGRKRPQRSRFPQSRTTALKTA